MNSNQNFDFMLIGELAQCTGANPKTIRFYEREGLIEPTRHGRFRVFVRNDEKKLKAILEMRSMGLPIAKIRKVLIKCREENNTDILGSSYLSQLLSEHVEKLTEQHESVKQQIEKVQSALNKVEIVAAA